ncbi:MAG: DNA-directed DNA polymerase [Candidatus Micrarchaeota archaeon]|nr:DNA-directed DNA polymerase [Candidatus Micrarchaeota archaeon]
MIFRKAYFLDADYLIKNNETYIRLLIKGKTTTRVYYRYDPYFYVDAPEEAKNDLEKVHGRLKDGKLVSPKSIDRVDWVLSGQPKKLFKVYCNAPPDVLAIKQAMPFPCYEYNLSFSKRFMFDMKLVPFSIIHYEREGKFIKKIIKIEESDKVQLNTLAFDIETYNPLGASRERKDPAIMISYAGKTSGVLSFKDANKEAHTLVPDEKTMLEKFCEIIAQENPDVIYGYNSSNFDFPYLQARAEVLNVKLKLGRKSALLKKVTKGMVTGMRVDGRIHIDIYPAARFFGIIGMIKSQQFTLEKIYEEVIGKKKFMVNRKNIWEMWDSNEIETLSQYSLLDSVVTKELGDHFLPLQIELSRVAKMPLFDVALSTSGQLVENLLMYEAAQQKMISPSRPSDGAVKERLANPIEGAYVKIPAPGIYDNIAVMDFRGLYPSIIVSYNIDPFTLTKDGNENECFVSPTGAKFIKKSQGLIPSVVNWLVDYRVKIKHELKKTNKDDEKYKILEARSNALKILTNSIYGYLGYARARWYSRECAESTTAWGRKHIQETIASAEKAGFEVLYGDTDSIFLLYKDRKQVLAFMEEINKSLPEKMELELEGFFTRGVFVGKKGGEERGAKKKYAMLGEDGRLKIRGFELVRRDWSDIAKNTQKKVLEAILREGSKEKAVAAVREAIARLKSGKVPFEELVIVTQLKKDPRDYDLLSPEVSAAKKLNLQGVPVEKGSVISYVVGKAGKSISDKAQPLEFAKDYDPDYYIDNQLMPAVMKILKELGYDEYDLKVGGKQKGLGDFF